MNKPRLLWYPKWGVWWSPEARAAKFCAELNAVNHGVPRFKRGV